MKMKLKKKIETLETHTPPPQMNSASIFAFSLSRVQVCPPPQADYMYMNLTMCKCLKLLWRLQKQNKTLQNSGCFWMQKLLTVIILEMTMTSADDNNPTISSSVAAAMYRFQSLEQNMTFFFVADAKKFDSSTSECHQQHSPWQLNWYFSCAKKVESISDHAGHEGIVVNYRCINRFYVKDVKLDKPFHVVRVEWLKDYPPHVLGGSSTQIRQDHLEREVWRVLSSVAAITAKLESASSKSEVMKSSKVLYNWLPAQVRQFAPLPSWTRPTFAPNQHVAKDVAIWRQNSLRNAGDNPATAVPSSYDDEEANPYWYAREKLVKLIRQEAFSFAAATTVEAGPEEISALLHTCDTSTRLSWVLDAVQPYLAKLEAQNSLLEAMGTMH
jgi:hypothetical protein